MQAIIFMGIQASGKSSFYNEHFLNSHIRISLDLLNTRKREEIFLETCFKTNSQFVVDNTNPSVEDRNRYITKARDYKYEVIGYYFSSSIKDAINRNNQRKGKAKIPEVGIRSVYSKLEMPSFSEGFDKLYFVSIKEGKFKVEDWKDEV